MAVLVVLRSSTSTPTSTSTSHNMLKYSHAKSNPIRKLLARALRGARHRACGGYVVADSGRAGEGAYCRLVGVAAFVEDCFACCAWGHAVRTDFGIIFKKE